MLLNFRPIEMLSFADPCIEGQRVFNVSPGTWKHWPPRRARYTIVLCLNLFEGPDVDSGYQHMIPQLHLGEGGLTSHYGRPASKSCRYG